MTPQRNDRAGFTLIEIVLVVVLLGIIVSMSLPSFRSSYNKFLLEKAGNDLAYLMRYAQSRAITQGKEIRLVFSEDFEKYWLEQRTIDSSAAADPSVKRGEKNSAKEAFTKIPGRWGRNFSVRPELKVQSRGISLVKFYPGGKIDRVTLHVCHGKSCAEQGQRDFEENSSKESCLQECMTVSTKYQRGAVQIFEGIVGE